MVVEVTLLLFDEDELEEDFEEEEDEFDDHEYELDTLLQLGATGG